MQKPSTTALQRGFVGDVATILPHTLHNLLHPRPVQFDRARSGGSSYHPHASRGYPRGAGLYQGFANHFRLKLAGEYRSRDYAWFRERRPSGPPDAVQSEYSGTAAFVPLFSFLCVPSEFCDPFAPPVSLQCTISRSNGYSILARVDHQHGCTCSRVSLSWASAAAPRRTREACRSLAG